MYVSAPGEKQLQDGVVVSRKHCCCRAAHHLSLPPCRLLPRSAKGIVPAKGCFGLMEALGTLHWPDTHPAAPGVYCLLNVHAILARPHLWEEALLEARECGHTARNPILIGCSVGAWAEPLVLH